MINMKLKTPPKRYYPLRFTDDQIEELKARARIELDVKVSVQKLVEYLLFSRKEKK